jgi:DNA-binding transcriptional LysR family regulator
MDTFTNMAVFVKVVDLGSFAGAARAFRLTPAAVSKQIKTLEEWLGVRLLDRTTRRLSLTEAGGRFYERCTHILEEVAEIKDEASLSQATPRGVLRVSAALSFSIAHLGPLISEYLAAFPEVSVEMDLSDRMVGLIDEGFDLAIRIGQLEDSSLIARTLAPCRYVLCA